MFLPDTERFLQKTSRGHSLPRNSAPMARGPHILRCQAANAARRRPDVASSAKPPLALHARQPLPAFPSDDALCRLVGFEPFRAFFIVHNLTILSIHFQRPPTGQLG